MRKQQQIQLLQFILARVLVWLFVVFVMEESFIDFILKYWLYLLIVTVSYFYYYRIEYELDKKYELIRNVIIYWNIYLFCHIFFRPLLNISHQLFVLLWLIILWLWRLWKLKTRWKIVWQVLWVVLSFFILISGIFYLYPDKPDVQWFIKTRPYKISVFGLSGRVEKSDAYIQVVSDKKTEDYILEQNFAKVLTENCKIVYPSLKKNRDEYVVLETSHGDLYFIYPQSEIQLEFLWNNLTKVKKLNWSVWFFSWLFESSIENEFENVDVEWNELVESIQNLYKYDLVYYLKNQISKNNMSLANNTIMYNIDWKILKYLAKIFPASFTRNLNNYREFQWYFELVPSDKVNLGRYFDTNKPNSIWDSFWGSIKNNMEVWLKNTYLWN